jgi:amino acid permease
MNGVISTSIGSAISLYLLVAFTGYLSFGIISVFKTYIGSNVSGNIIAMYANSAAATFGRAAIVVLMLFSYPLQAHPCRGSLDKIFAWRPRNQAVPPPNPKSGPTEMRYSSSLHNLLSDSRFALITALIIAASYAVAMTVSSLDRVLAFVGSTGSTAISFILPGIFYHRMTRAGGLLPRTPEDGGKDDDDESQVDEDEGSQESLDAEETERANKGRARRKRIRRNSSLVLVLYGFVIMAVCLTINIVVGGGH